MSEPKQFKVNIDGIRMTPKEELDIYLLWKQERSAPEIQDRVLRPDGDVWSLSKIRKLIYKFKKGYSPKLSGDEIFDKVTGVEFEESLKNFDEKKSMTNSFKMAMRLLEKSLEDAEKGYEIVDEAKRKIPIKTIIDAIEKAGKFWALQRKTDKDSGSSGKVMTIDYKEMAKIYMEAKKDGINYDAKTHMKDLLEMVSKPEEDDNEDMLDLSFTPDEFEE